jgi:DNA-binding transcriptional LysR family regulator
VRRDRRVAIRPCPSRATFVMRAGIAPVAATRAVAALEKELRVLLLRRTTRSVGLTQQGADYLARS